MIVDKFSLNLFSFMKELVNFRNAINVGIMQPVYDNEQKNLRLRAHL